MSDANDVALVEVRSSLYSSKFIVGGMTCSSCVSTVEQCIEKMPGVQCETVSVSLLEETAVVVYRSACADATEAAQTVAVEIVDAVESVGFDCKHEGTDAIEPEQHVFKGSFVVEGMTCSSCVGTVEKGIGLLQIATHVSVSLLEEAMTVTFESSDDATSLARLRQDVIDAVEDLGFECRHISTERIEGVGNRRAGSAPRQPLKLLFVFESEKKNRDDLLTSLKACFTNTEGVKNVMESETFERSGDRQRDRFIGLVVTYDDMFVGIRTLEETLEAKLNLNVEKDYTVDVVKTSMDSLMQRKSDHVKRYKRAFLISAAFTVPCFMVSMVLPAFSGMKMALHMNVFPGLHLSWMAFLMWIFATPVQFGSGMQFYREAYAGMKHKSFGMSFLIAAGTSAAYFYSAFAVIYGMASNEKDKNNGAHFFETSAMLISFVLLGKLLELTAKKETSSAIAALSKLSAKSAFLVSNYKDHASEMEGSKDGSAIDGRTIDVDHVQRGDILKVVPGDTLAADGIVVRGESTVNESMLTGESMPVRKVVGDVVTGSTMNIDGNMLIRVTETGPNTTLSSIIGLVQEAQVNKPKIQIFADKVAGVFVPVVSGIALLTFVVWICITSAGVVPREWYPYGESNLVMSLTFAIAVLVIACPCALGLATPTAIMVGTSVGASLGILVKSGDALEAAQTVTDIVFDKTGTLTNGKPTVTTVVIFPALPPLFQGSSGERAKLTEADVLYLIGSAEQGSEHPLAKAVVAKAKDTEGVPSLVEPSDFKAVPGRGISATVTDNAILIGNRNFMKEKEASFQDESMVEESMRVLESTGKTCVLIAVNGTVCSMIAIHDKEKNDAAVTLAALRAMNLRVWMLTGDNRRTAEAIAFELGIAKEFVVAEVMPHEKSEKVVELQSKGRIVAMVGDGVNDSPALAQANLGIAIGAGADVAIEAADLVLVNSQLTSVIAAIDLSRTVYRRICMNMIWACAYNVLGIPVAAGVFFPLIKIVLPPEIAAAAMALSSVSVVMSSVMLKRYKPPVVESSYGRSLRDGTLGLETIEMQVRNEGLLGSEHKIKYAIDHGCMMAFDGPCTCDAELCKCVNCSVHGNK